MDFGCLEMQHSNFIKIGSGLFYVWKRNSLIFIKAEMLIFVMIRLQWGCLEGSFAIHPSKEWFTIVNLFIPFCSRALTSVCWNEHLYLPDGVFYLPAGVFYFWLCSMLTWIFFLFSTCCCLFTSWSHWRSISWSWSCNFGNFLTSRKIGVVSLTTNYYISNNSKLLP